MEHNANILKPNKGIIPSLLKVFAIFELRLIDDGDKVEAIAIMRINHQRKILPTFPSTQSLTMYIYQT